MDEMHGLRHFSHFRKKYDIEFDFILQGGNFKKDCASSVFLIDIPSCNALQTIAKCEYYRFFTCQLHHIAVLDPISYLATVRMQSYVERRDTGPLQGLEFRASFSKRSTFLTTDLPNER